MLTIVDQITELSEDVKAWVLSNQHNPIFWTILFFVGLAVFWFTFNALNKNN